jgi:glutathione synthase/RimK-type ligase-like ATP-grasp enzyme
MSQAGCLPEECVGAALRHFPTRMIACLYGRPFVPFLEPALTDLCAAAAAAGGQIWPVSIEGAHHRPARCALVRRLYVLPFDLSADAAGPTMNAALVHELFPEAEVVIPFAVQDLCWDKVAAQARLVERGIPVPDTYVGSEPGDVHEFVRQHGYAILKERTSCGGHGHIVLWLEDGTLYGDGGSHRYVIDLVRHGERRLRGERLTYPAPFYVQRLVADVTSRGMTAPQVLRAYVVDHQIPFWTERYRDRYQRPSDWIINVSRGAKYRFLFDLSEEARKIALRAADVVGARIAAVDLVRTGSSGPYVLEVDTDGQHMLIDRQFKSIPEYRDFFDLDRYIAEALLAEPPPPWHPPRRETPPEQEPPRRGRFRRR